MVCQGGKSRGASKSRNAGGREKTGQSNTLFSRSISRDRSEYEDLDDEVFNNWPGKDDEKNVSSRT